MPVSNRPPNLSSLTLGTVQFGLPYGLNSHEMIDEETVFEVLDVAWSRGITSLDTAAAYGEAEARIGTWLAGNPANTAYIVSKVPELVSDGASITTQIEQSVKESQQKLGVERLDGMMFHEAVDLLEKDSLKVMRNAVAQGDVAGFGVSVYEPFELEELIDLPDLRMVQLPYSIFNREFSESGMLDRCKERDILVFVRSVFLRGMALVDPARLPEHLAALEPILVNLRGLAAEASVSMVELLVAAVANDPRIDSVVLGAVSVEQVKAFPDQMQLAAMSPTLCKEAAKICTGLGEDILDIRQWKKFKPLPPAS